ncbi:MAG: hypothetical protein JXA87_03930 [Thermoleophilia bacterium]|nr:hypothetical protein [Thermoleophilia bacterium]
MVVVDIREKARYERAYQRLFHQSFRRLAKQGLSEQAAGQIARQVAEDSLDRAKAPVLGSEREFACAVGQVCTRLRDGKSYYDLIGEMPYLASARIDRVVAAGARTQPPVDEDTLRAAKRATQLERLSGASALLLAGVALGAFGLWYAVAAGLVVAVATEVYVQAGMSPSLRRWAARLRLPIIVMVAAIGVLLYFGYRWVDDTDPRTAFVFLGAICMLVIAVLVPGFTLAQMVARRDRGRRKELELKLLREWTERQREPEE